MGCFTRKLVQQPFVKKEADTAVMRLRADIAADHKENAVKYISSAQNESLKLYRKLSSSKKDRISRGQFVLEGVRLVSDCTKAAEKKYLPEYLFVTEEALERYPDRLTEDFLQSCGHTAIISKEAAAAISLTDTPQGVYAICSMPEKKDISGFDAANERLLILDDLQDPGNLGTIIRTADAFGISLALCSCCDVYSPKTVRSAMGSIFRVRFYHDSFESVTAKLRSDNVRVLASVLSEDAAYLGECSLADTAVVIGNEGSGMPPEHISMCDGGLTIKMRSGIDSLNAAMAAGIIMYSMQ